MKMNVSKKPSKLRPLQSFSCQSCASCASCSALKFASKTTCEALKADFVKTSPRSSEIYDFFFENLAIFRYGIVVNVLKTNYKIQDIDIILFHRK